MSDSSRVRCEGAAIAVAKGEGLSLGRFGDDVMSVEHALQRLGKLCVVREALPEQHGGVDVHALAIDSDISRDAVGELRESHAVD